MTESADNAHIRDAAYVRFPSFKEWMAATIVDRVRWYRYNESLQSRAKGLSGEALVRARNVATRAAAIDTGAIEGLYEVDRGFTYTVATETAAWEAALSSKGEHVKSLFEAQMRAYDYVLDLATKAQAIAEASIRALHSEICKPQETYRVVTSIGFQEQPLPKGQYKASPNHVVTRKGAQHSYAPVDVTPVEMARLVAELGTEEFLSEHPVLQASYAHYGLVSVHPFADGNGRVARALASAFTYRAAKMPIVILSEHKEKYLDALEAADAGEYQRFVNFMLARCLDTIELVDASLRLAGTTRAEDSLAALGRLYFTRGGFTHEQVDQAGFKLLEVLQKAVTDALSKLPSPRVSAAATILPGMHGALPPAYRFPLKNDRHLQINVKSHPPVPASAVRNYILALPRDAAGDDDIQLLRINERGNMGDAFIARVDELIPTVSGVMMIRANLFAERMVNEVLFELRQAAAQAMGKSA